MEWDTGNLSLCRTQTQHNPDFCNHQIGRFSVTTGFQKIHFTRQQGGDST